MTTRNRTILSLLAIAAFALPAFSAYVPPPAIAGDMYNLMGNPQVVNYGFKMGTSYMQRFRSNLTTYPTELAVVMGRGNYVYNALLVVQVNDVEVFRHNFSGLVRRTSDGATVLPIKGLNQLVFAGSYVTFIITPNADIPISALQLEGSISAGARSPTFRRTTRRRSIRTCSGARWPTVRSRTCSVAG